MGQGFGHGDIGLEEIVPAKVCGQAPRDFVVYRKGEIVRFRSDEKDVKHHVEGVVAPFGCHPEPGGGKANGEFFLDFPVHAGSCRFMGPDFPTGKLPAPGMGFARGASGEKNPAVFFEDCGSHIDPFQLGRPPSQPVPGR